MTWYQTFSYFENSSSTTKFAGVTIQTSNRNSYDVRLKLISIYVDDDLCPKIKALVQNIETFKFPQVVHSCYIQNGLQRLNIFSIES